MIFHLPEWPFPLQDPAEAALFSSLLDEEGIPHQIVQHGDVLWGFSEQISLGWGHVETVPEHEKRLEELYEAFQASEAADSD